MSKAHEELEIIAELFREWAKKYGYKQASGYVIDGHATFWTRDQIGKEELEVHVGYEEE